MPFQDEVVQIFEGLQLGGLRLELLAPVVAFPCAVADAGTRPVDWGPGRR
ncbi:MAG TPA: hypothetical protein VGC54_12660 [Planctomycetota bacterium]